MQETQEICIWSLGGEDPLEKEMTTHSSILAWEIPWTKEPGGLQSIGLQKSRSWLSNQAAATGEITFYFQTKVRENLFLGLSWIS